MQLCFLGQGGCKVWYKENLHWIPTLDLLHQLSGHEASGVTSHTNSQRAEKRYLREGNFQLDPGVERVALWVDTCGSYLWNVSGLRSRGLGSSVGGPGACVWALTSLLAGSGASVHSSKRWVRCAPKTMTDAQFPAPFYTQEGNEAQKGERRGWRSRKATVRLEPRLHSPYSVIFFFLSLNKSLFEATWQQLPRWENALEDGSFTASFIH